MVQSLGLSTPAEKKKKVEKEKAPSKKPAKSSPDKPAKSVSGRRWARASTDTRINELDQKWSDHFNQLEALLMARTLDRQESTFQTHALILHQPVSSGLPTPSSRRPTSRTLFCQICLEPTLLLPSNSLPANLTLTDLTPTDLRRWTDQGLHS